ncbi:MAG: exodeoxyribonuclease III [Candidatus Cloacimonetes bacterium]|nr:exodeoxyribonuclease III [Candidatus Cloacimonadota bacterium]
MKILSFNVNGLRAIMNKDFMNFLSEYNPDILGIQETKLQEAQIPTEIKNLSNYHIYWSFANRKGYSGTALFSKSQPKSVSYNIGDDRFDGEGRIIQAEYEDFILFNIYFPNGQMNDERLQYKLAFYEQFLLHVEKLKKAGKNIIVIGDFNTAHKEIDLSHPKENVKFSGFLPIEREWIDKFLSNGYVDTFRHFDSSPQKYSWWTYRMGARERNIGWRIDYCFTNIEFLSKIKNAFILNDVFGSDHCPVGIELY